MRMLYPELLSPAFYHTIRATHREDLQANPRAHCEFRTQVCPADNGGLQVFVSRVRPSQTFKPQHCLCLKQETPRDLHLLVGARVGARVGAAEAVGELDGRRDGVLDGWDVVGEIVGTIEGEPDGNAVGVLEGDWVGGFVGALVGRLVGRLVFGRLVGLLVGALVGALVGCFVGAFVGAVRSTPTALQAACTFAAYAPAWRIVHWLISTKPDIGVKQPVLAR